jgi:hypothetical protein
MCDALIQYTLEVANIPLDVDVTELTCFCAGMCTLLSVEDATILPITNERQQMETTQYLQSQIDELKEIISRQNSALATHQNCDYWKSENGRIGRQIIELINDSYDNGNDAEDILTSLCEIVDYNPTKEISFTATINFTGTIQVAREDQDGFDLSDILGEAYVDINHGDVVIDSYELYDAEEC